MKIRLLAGNASEGQLRAEWKEAKKVSEVRLGEHFLFYRYFIRISAIGYEEIKKAFLRIESGEVGEFPLTEHYLILLDQKGTEHKLRLEHPEDVKEVLAYFAEHYPGMEIGHYRKKGHEKSV